MSAADRLRARLRDVSLLAPDANEARASFMLRDHVLGEVAKIGAGCTMLAVKGAGLAYDVYPTPWQRPMNDMDLVVRATERDSLVGSLLANGFKLTLPPSERTMSHAMMAEDELIWERGDARVAVELHTSLDKIASRPVDVEGIIRRGRRHPTHPMLLVPDVVDHVLLVVQHAGASDYAHEIAWIDLELLLQRGVNFDLLVERARAWKLLTPLWISFTVMRSLGSRFVPADWLAAVRPPRARRALLGRYYAVERYPVATRTDLGWPWVVRQTVQREDTFHWSISVLRYGIVRGLERLHTTASTIPWRRARKAG